MGNINIQTLTLLATIIGVASNLLSISQNLRKNGVIAMLKGLSLCCLLYTSDAADDLLCVDLGG